MNILFVLYGDFNSNSANPLVLYARELQSRGHRCAIAVPSNLESSRVHENPAFTPILYAAALASPDAVFPDGRPADVIHACTPRDVVHQFVTAYMAKRPTPLVIYLEDNEAWISRRELGVDEAGLFSYSEREIAEKLPGALSHPFRYNGFIGLADAVAVIQDKLKTEVPPWVHCETVMIGVDLDFFSPRPADVSLRERYGVAESERVIVYHGGLDQFKLPAMENLCRAVGLINRQGIPCRLLRTGLRPLSFLQQLPRETASAISDLGVLPKRELPGLLSLADVCVQPGEIDAFEDLRLPGKVPEFLAMARPVVMPDANVAHLFRDGLDAVLLRTGRPEEIAAKCVDLFSDPERANQIGRAGRVLAEKYFDVRSQAGRLEKIYEAACGRFDSAIASEVWRAADEPIALRLACKLMFLADIQGRQSRIDTGEVLRQHARYIQAMERRVNALEMRLAERERQIPQLITERERTNQYLASIEGSLAWILIGKIRHIRDVFFPGSTRRRKVYESIKDSLKLFIRRDAAAGEQEHKKPKFWQILKSQAAIAKFERLSPYEAWIRVNGWTHKAEADLRRRLSEAKEPLPLISVVMPVFDSPLPLLEEAILSVRNQIYGDWELCIADDASTSNAVREVLTKYAASDARVKVTFRLVNGDISRATNTAAVLAEGEFLLFLDHDDVLTPDALGEIALYLAENPDVDLVYSDDDKIDDKGRQFDPQFKPDWSPELLLSYMYCGHLLCVRRGLFDEVGGMREGYEGSQDYDFALRVTERCRGIGHIPLVLYHWRAHPGSTASSGRAKPKSFEAGRRAVEEALKRRGLQATVYQPEWAVRDAVGMFWHEFPDHGPKVAIIIPTKNSHTILQSCLSSIESTTYKNYEIVIIDNDSTDPATLAYLKNLSHRVLRIPNPGSRFNFAAIINRAVERVDAEYVLFLNNDTEVRDSRWLSRMMGYAQLGGVGAVGARLLFPDGRVQHAGVVHGLYHGQAGHAFRFLASHDFGYLSYAMVTRNYSAVTAACMLTPRRLFLASGGLDEKTFGVAYNDVDYCYRLSEKGYRCVFCPGAELIHHEGYSRGFVDNPEEVAAFMEKYRQYVDPYYNPNLSLDSETFSIQPRKIPRTSETSRFRALMCAHNLNCEGAPQSQFELTVALKELGVIDPIVFSPSDGPLRCSYEQLGVEVVLDRYSMASADAASDSDRGIEKFVDLVRSLGVDLIYGNTLQTFYAIAAAEKLNLPCVWNPRESEPWQTYFNFLAPGARKRALKCFGYPYRVIFVSDASREAWEELNRSHNFAVIRNALNTYVLERKQAHWTRERARGELAVQDDEIVIISVGTVCARKGQKDLPLALGTMAQTEIVKIRCFIVGDRENAYAEELRQLVAQLPDNLRARVQLVPETVDVAKYYLAADIFACTSRVESYPRVILEAMWFGLPIVTTSVFGIKEQVQDNVNGLFYQPENVEELATIVTRLVTERALRTRLGKNAGKVLKSLGTFDDMVRAYAQIFQEAYWSKDYPMHYLAGRNGERPSVLDVSSLPLL